MIVYFEVGMNLYQNRKVQTRIRLLFALNNAM